MSTIPTDAVADAATSADKQNTSILVRVTVPDQKLQKCLLFDTTATVWTAKQQVLDRLAKDLPDALNYGLYMPPSGGKAGKFLDEERALGAYALSGPVAELEFQYKRRVYLSVPPVEKLRKLHTKANFRKFMDHVLKGHVDKVREFLGKGLDPNFVDEDSGETPLSIAAASDSIDMIFALKEGGMHLDFRNRDGTTAIHRSALAGTHRALKTLLDLGASPDYRDIDGLSALYRCCMRGGTGVHVRCAEILLKDRCLVGIQDGSGWTALHQACKFGHETHVELLLLFGANPDDQNITGNTPLHVCASFNNHKITKILLQKGASRDVKNRAGLVPYDVAVMAKAQECIDLLVNFQVDESAPPPAKPVYFERQVLSSVDLKATTSPRGGGLSESSSRRPSVEEFQRPRSRTKSMSASPTSHPRAKALSHVRSLTLEKGQGGFGFRLVGTTTGSSGDQCIRSVDQGSPADKAGLLPGDVVLGVGHHSIHGWTHRQVVDEIVRSGQRVVLTVGTPALTVRSHGEVETSNRQSSAPPPPSRNVKSAPSSPPTMRRAVSTDPTPGSPLGRSSRGQVHPAAAAFAKAKSQPSSRKSSMSHFAAHDLPPPAGPPPKAPPPASPPPPPPPPASGDASPASLRRPPPVPSASAKPPVSQGSQGPAPPPPPPRQDISSDDAPSLSGLLAGLGQVKLKKVDAPQEPDDASKLASSNSSGPAGLDLSSILSVKLKKTTPKQQPPAADDSEDQSKSMLRGVSLKRTGKNLTLDRQHPEQAAPRHPTAQQVFHRPALSANPQPDQGDFTRSRSRTMGAEQFREASPEKAATRANRSGSVSSSNASPVRSAPPKPPPKPKAKPQPPPPPPPAAKLKDRVSVQSPSPPSGSISSGSLQAEELDALKSLDDVIDSALSRASMRSSVYISPSGETKTDEIAPALGPPSQVSTQTKSRSASSNSSPTRASMVRVPPPTMFSSPSGGTASSPGMSFMPPPPVGFASASDQAKAPSKLSSDSSNVAETSIDDRRGRSKEPSARPDVVRTNGNKPQITKPSRLPRARCMHAFSARYQDELSFEPGDFIDLIQMPEGGWWQGSTKSGESGWFPSNHVVMDAGPVRPDSFSPPLDAPPAVVARSRASGVPGGFEDEPETKLPERKAKPVAPIVPVPAAGPLQRQGRKEGPSAPLSGEIPPATTDQRSSSPPSNNQSGVPSTAEHDTAVLPPSAGAKRSSGLVGLAPPPPAFASDESLASDSSEKGTDQQIAATQQVQSSAAKNAEVESSRVEAGVGKESEVEKKPPSLQDDARLGLAGPPTSWSATQVGEYLTRLGLGAYSEDFVENSIEGEHLLELTKDDLKELGISRLGHRMTLMKAIAALKSV